MLVHCESFGINLEEGDAILGQIFDTIVMLECPAADLHDYLLDEKSPKLSAELARRQDAARGAAESDKYKEKHREYMASKGVSWATLQPPPGTKQSPWFMTLPPREKEVIAFTIQAVPGAISVDCGQRVDRAPTGRGHTLPTVTPGGKTFLMYPARGSDQPRNRFLIGSEALCLQGFPMNLFDAVPEESRPSEPQLADLAGNAFPSTVLAAVLLAVYAHLPAEAPSVLQESSDFNPDAVMELLA